VGDVALRARCEIVEAKPLVSISQEPVAKMGPQKPGSACYEDRPSQVLPLYPTPTIERGAWRVVWKPPRRYECVSGLERQSLYVNIAVEKPLTEPSGQACRGHFFTEPISPSTVLSPSKCCPAGEPP
jgi:hypothetical protein